MEWFVGSGVAAVLGALFLVTGDFVQSWGKTVQGVFFGHERVGRAWAFSKTKSGHYVLPRVIAFGLLGLAAVLAWCGVLSLFL